MYRFLLLVAICYGGYLYWSNRPVSVAEGVLVAQPPKQQSISSRSLRHGDFTLSPVASFDISARVLSKKNYHTDAGAKLVKTDLALGWGRMSDSRVLDKLKISQGNRFFYWRYENQPPIPRDEIISSAANMHLIAATPQIQDALDNIRPNHLVRLTGKLVNVSSASGFRWNTSTQRNDTGNGACELVYVESVTYQ